MSAYLIGNDVESVRILTRAHQSCVERRETTGAARCAFWIGFQLINKGEMAQASGWFARGQRLLADAGTECAEEGLLLVPVALQHLFAGDAATACDIFGRAAEIGDRFDDPDVRCAGRGWVADRRCCDWAACPRASPCSMRSWWRRWRATSRRWLSACCTAL